MPFVVNRIAGAMPRSDRLYQIIRLLHDGQRHRAEDMAAALNVSQRTIYRDMDTLMATGLPIEGERGVGYRIGATITLPPINLTTQELEALNLGIAIVAQSPDPDLRAAADALAHKIDAGLPTETIAPARAWKFVTSPFADATRSFAHIPVIRAAIVARQKLDIRYHVEDGSLSRHTVRPLNLEYWGRVWTLTAWCESHSKFSEFRIDLVAETTPLPALFVDEPGKRLEDFQSS
jgi:predicted DNA-binding transcriptional regulator YafY